MPFLWMLGAAVAIAAAGGGPANGPLAPLRHALDDAQLHAESLSEEAERAPAAPMSTLRARPSEDLVDAMSAVVAADDALGELERDAPSELRHDAVADLRGELNDVHTALSMYSIARTNGDRQAMGAAADDAIAALGRAEDILKRGRTGGVPNRD